MFLAALVSFFSILGLTAYTLGLDRRMVVIATQASLLTMLSASAYLLSGPSAGLESSLSLGRLPSSLLPFPLDISFSLDPLALLFFSILLGALFICLALLSLYFEGDLNGASISLLSSIFSQLAFAYFTSGDLFTLITLWELISFVSFLLIQHWSGRALTLKAALKVFTISHLGDLVFLSGALLLISYSGTVSISSILALTPLLSSTYLGAQLQISVASLSASLLCTAVILKGAQFIFFPWLLDAMEAPVPISAQLHSSTLVIIGFYLIYRLQDLIASSRLASYILFSSSSLTVVGASVLGFYQTDGKKLLACSTASQLGYVLVAISLGLWDESLRLLPFVCCNKAATFAWFGAFMVETGGVSDFRLARPSQLTLATRGGLLTSLANSSIAPGSLVWHVKSLLLVGGLGVDPSYHLLGLGLLSLTWFFSSLYSFRLVYCLCLAPSPSTHTLAAPAQPLSPLFGAAALLTQIALSIVGCSYLF